MAIIVRKPESSFTPCPEGLHQAVCVDVVDLGLQETPWGAKAKVELRWQTDLVNEHTQKRFELRKRYTASLHEKARLRQDLECWRGRKFTEQELAAFDLEKLLAVNCQLQVIHNISDEGRIYDNVQTIVPFNGKMGPKLAPLDYVRQRDRARTMDTNGAAADVEEEAVPF